MILVRHMPLAVSSPPSVGKEFKPFGDIGSLDDFDGPFSQLGQTVPRFVASIATIGEDVTQPWIERTDRGQDIDSAVAVLDVGETVSVR